jgi:D-alanine-D-alanine ligase
VRAFEALNAVDLSRVDFRLDAGGAPQLVEINTLPGLRPQFSDMWILSNAEGVSYDRLVIEILNLARERYGI